MEVFTLTAKSRAAIWAQLTDDQLAVLAKYTLYASKSQLFNDIYARGARWRFVGVNIDYHWEQKPRDLRQFPHYHCQCGRIVKNQYVLEAVAAPHQRIYLGVTHFAQELGIPAVVASEVRKRVNTIQMYMDEVLTYYKWGRRFPAERYTRGRALGAFSDDGAFAVKLADFARANFPLFHLDQQRFEQRLLRVQNKAAKPAAAPVKQTPATALKTAAPAATVGTPAEAALPGDALQLIARFCACSVSDLRRHLQRTSERDLFLLALAADCGINVHSSHPQLTAVLAHLRQKTLRADTARILHSTVQRTAARVRREQALLIRLLEHNWAAAGTKAGRAQMRKILLQNTANQRRKHNLRTTQIARYQEELARRVATQFARVQQGGADNYAKFSLDWQYTLQRLQERTLYEVGSGRLG